MLLLILIRCIRSTLTNAIFAYFFKTSFFLWYQPKVSEHLKQN
ncbi:AgrD family cyclic lactone autoinducer peptide [Carboxydothermus pertinax]